MKRTTLCLLLIALAAPAQTKKAAPNKSESKKAAPKKAESKPLDIPKLEAPPKQTGTAIPSMGVPKLPDVHANIVTPGQSARQPAADTSLGLKPAPPREFAPLDVQSFTLANGMHVVLHEDHRAPWLAGNLRLQVGAVLDPPLKAGLAELTLRTLRTGGGRKSNRADQQDRLDRLGAVFQVDAGDRASSLVFRSMSSHLSEILTLVSESVVDPSFDDDALEDSRAALRNRVSARNNNVETIASREAQRPALGGWFPPEVEYSTLANAGPEDVRLFHAQHVRPGAATLILTGDFAAAALRPRIEAMFGGWKPAGNASLVMAKQALAPAGVHFAEVTRAQAAGFALARTGPALGTPDAAAAAVLAELLSGGSSSRLAQLSQAKQSWQLRTISALEPVVGRPPLFSIRAICDTPYPVDAILGIMDEMGVIRKGEVPEAAVDAARRVALSSWIAQFPNALSRLSFEESARRAQLPPEFVANHFKAIAAVRKADVVRVARDLLEPKTFHAALVANSTLLNRPLTEFREAILPVDLTIPVARPLETKATPASITEGKAWLAKVQAALGGIAALTAVKDLEIVSKGTHGSSSLQLTDRWIAPGTLRQDQETQNGVTSVFYNGEIGWIGTTGRVSPLSQGMLVQVRGELLRLLPLLATSDRDPSRTVSHGGANVLLITGDRGAAVRIYVDEASNLPARLVYQSVNPAGLPAAAEETWSEWRESGGIKFPGKIQLRMDGRRAGEMIVTSVKVNSGLKLADVERKP